MTMCLLLGGPEYDIVVRGRTYHFEMHPYNGPNLINPDGSVKVKQPAERDPFWRAVALWEKQGRRLEAEGRCVWDLEPVPVIRHLRGRQYLVVGERMPDDIMVESIEEPSDA
jgi:hypothetical protein